MLVLFNLPSCVHWKHQGKFRLLVCKAPVHTTFAAYMQGCSGVQARAHMLSRTIPCAALALHVAAGWSLVCLGNHKPAFTTSRVVLLMV